MATKKATKKQVEEVQIDVTEIRRGTVEYCLVGETDLVYHAMSQKAKQELLCPSPKAVGSAAKAERERRLKHVPIDEYRACFYQRRDEDEGPTQLVVPNQWIKGAVCSAGVDIPGTARAQLGRLLTVMGESFPLYGIPELWMTTVVQSGMGRTPDIRTRPRIRRWATRVTVRYVQPMLTEKNVTNLMIAAGTFIGVGDNRQQKGSGNCGLWKIVSSTDPEYLEILKTGGRRAQLDAIEAPLAFDRETETLLGWFEDEVVRREQRGTLPVVKQAHVDAPEGVM